jgi:hypothetical protein
MSRITLWLAPLSTGPESLLPERPVRTAGHQAESGGVRSRFMQTKRPVGLFSEVPRASTPGRSAPDRPRDQLPELSPGAEQRRATAVG